MYNIYNQVVYYFGKSVDFHKFVMGVCGFIYLSVVALLAAVFLFWFLRDKVLARYDNKQIAVVLFLTYFIVCILSSFWVVKFNPSGDEPYYILSGYSLTQDKDINLENNVINKDWQNFYKGDLLIVPIYFLNSKYSGGMYLLKGLGIEVISGLGYMLAGRMGILILTSLAGALIVYNIYLCCVKMSNQKKYSVLAVIFTGFAAPLFAYSLQVYSEIFAGLIIIYVIRRLFFHNYNNAKDYIFMSICIALLTILHIKFLPISIMLLLVLVYYCHGNVRKLVSSIIPGLFIFVLYSVFNLILIGNFLPMGSYYRSDSDMLCFKPLSQLLSGAVFGMLLDQEFGLFVYAPIYIIAIMGMWIYYKLNKNKNTLILFIFLGAYYLFFSFMRFWHGAEFVRYLLPIIPVFTPFIVLALSRCNSRLFKLFVLIFSVLSFLITFAVTMLPDLRYGVNDGVSPLLRYLNYFSGVKISNLFPSYTVKGCNSWPLTLVYGGLFVLFSAYFIRNCNLNRENKINR